jgi:hypothetical protein
MSSAQPKCSEMLRKVSATLERAGIRRYIPSGYGDNPESVEPNDVDIRQVVSQERDLETRCRRLPPLMEPRHTLENYLK